MNEQEQIKKGQEIADLLMLKPCIDYPDRYDTTWGNKTPLGLYLTLKRIMKD